jgi:glycosyltransferase involved in cell wall biosynthesis
LVMRSDFDGAIVHFVHSLTGGGTERTLVSLLQSFGAKSSRHIVVTQRIAGELSTHLPENVACNPLEVRGRSRWAWLRLARLMCRWNGTVLHARNTGCWMDAIMASLFTPRMQLLLGFHGLDTGAPFSRRQRRIARWGLRAGARFVSVSRAGQRQLEQQARIPSDWIDVLPNGVDLARFQRIDPVDRRRTRSGWHLDDGTFVVGVVGSLTPVKRHDILIRAISEVVRHVDNIKLIVVGDGPLRETLAALAKAEHVCDKVIFTGTRRDIPRVLAGMDAYVCSSESEGMNNSLLEAMAVGLPVIATDVGDNALVVRNGIDGQIVPPGSCASLVNALVSYHQERALRNRFATAARERVKEYSFDRSVAAYERYYRDASRAAARGLSTSGKGALGEQYAAPA